MRARWNSRIIFLFAAIGSAVGLGNVWRFPYLAYEYGGGAFLIPYLLALFILGIPLLILEFAIGQKFQSGAISSFKAIHPRLRGIGFMAIFSGFVVMVYYSAVMAWTLVFLFDSFQSPLPWAQNSETYFFQHVLNKSESISQLGGISPALFTALLLTWVSIYLCVRKGVKSVGKVVVITMPLPIIFLVILFVRGMTLDGAWSGVIYYISPDFSALFDTKIWLAAASQIFFSLSLGFGIMIAYASYNKKNQDIVGDALITGVTNSCISLLSGFVVFSVIGFMATQVNANVKDVITSGPGLAFVVFPKALSLMPFASFFAALFFLMLLTLGIDSAFSLVEAINTVIADVKKVSMHYIALVVCSVAFVCALLFVTDAGLYYLDIFDHFITNFGLVTVGILQCIVVGWIYGAPKLREYVNSVSTLKLGKWWDIMICYIIPIILSTLIVIQFNKELQGSYNNYPIWAIYLGASSVVIPIVILILSMIFTTKEESNESAN
ncbi:sodium-dependent transporter [Candidatus Uabimicrobium amorphum]|uniref:Transporter n=1 Tax=Uabimicrobium amorphum TaxID=2596890 RepID=A0A5S9IRV2_UABAM|nr:sodium-dependent transporter [Candidatus Uabimicrobium amorphum]BBM86983.1 transporter [Candidatus Uabimicrobium amorphum]